MRYSPAFAALLVLTPALACAKPKGKKPAEPPPPPVGWYQETGFAAQCYNPPVFTALQQGDRRFARQDALSALTSQWKGEKGTSFDFDPRMIEGIETELLGRPEKIEWVVAENHAQCRKVQAGGGKDAWAAWFAGLPTRLTAGECVRPLDYTMFDYLDIGTSWQRSVPVCSDDKVLIKASIIDHYRITDKGPWINVEGDKSARPAEGAPCTLEKCFPGQLILRFQGQSGIELIVPIGAEATFVPPEHGTIEVTINDNTYFDNVYKIEQGIIHHTSIQYSPAP
jgi:hypothetical protein